MTMPAEQNIPSNRKRATVDEFQVARLAERARAGNRSSFELLINIFQDEIFRMVYYRTGSQMDAEDLTQDIFVKAISNLHGLRDVHRFRPWLFSIAVNRVRDFRRKRRILVFMRGRGQGEGLEHGDREPHDNPQAFHHIIRREFWEQMRCFLDRLSRYPVLVAWRNVILLFRVQRLRFLRIGHQGLPGCEHGNGKAFWEPV